MTLRLSRARGLAFLACVACGRALAAQGKLAEAATHFEQAVRIDPGDSLARQSLTETRARLRRSP